MSNQTAVKWFYEKIKSHVSNESLLLGIFEEAKQKEREQHGNTWDSAIQAHEDRGHVIARSLTDFDEYEIK